MDSERDRFNEFLASLDTEKFHSEFHNETIKQIWDKIVNKYPYVREPLVGSTEDDEIYLHWSYTDIEEKIEIQSISDHIDFTFINNKIILNVRMMDINELDPFLIYFVHFLARVL